MKSLQNDEQLTKRLITEYYKGLSQRKIAHAIGTSEAWARSRIRKLKKEGILKELPQVKHKKPIIEFKNGCVNCTYNVSKKCIYGIRPSDTPSQPRCNYMLIEGHSRGCPPTACDKFQEGHKKKLVEDWVGCVTNTNYE